MPAVIEREHISTGALVRRKVFSWERLVQVLLLLTLLAIWEVAGRIMGDFFLAPPSSLPSAFWEMWQAGELVRALLDSLSSLLVGFCLAIVVGISVGFFMGWYGPAGRTLNPFVSALYVVPTAALVPMFIIWFGLGFTARTVTVFLFCVFEILVSTYTGVRNVDRNLVDAARAFGASRWQLFSRVVSYASLPYIFAGLRMGISRAVKGMVVAELLFAVTGLGGLISSAANYYRTDKVFVGVIVLAMLGVLLAGAVQLLERRLMPWHRGVNA
ncbi:ABC transporter permease [Mycolicibacterium litorale]|uniref:ABC transporter permease n=1 Tax=Mycolicibacterium litorale TaxID=758802 RepID=UPI003CEDCBC5